MYLKLRKRDFDKLIIKNKKLIMGKWESDKLVLNVNFNLFKKDSYALIEYRFKDIITLLHVLDYKDCSFLLSTLMINFEKFLNGEINHNYYIIINISTGEVLCGDREQLDKSYAFASLFNASLEDFISYTLEVLKANCQKIRLYTYG